MKRLIAPSVVGLCILAACAQGDASKPAASAAPATAPAPPTPAPDVRIGTLQLMCGGESVRVAFDSQAAKRAKIQGTNRQSTRETPWRL